MDGGREGTWRSAVHRPAGSRAQLGYFTHARNGCGGPIYFFKIFTYSSARGGSAAARGIPCSQRAALVALTRDPAAGPCR